MTSKPKPRRTTRQLATLLGKLLAILETYDRDVHQERCPECCGVHGRHADVCPWHVVEWARRWADGDDTPLLADEVN